MIHVCFRVQYPVFDPERGAIALVYSNRVGMNIPPSAPGVLDPEGVDG